MLFNEPKLLKFNVLADYAARVPGFSALQRAEIAEIIWQRSGLFAPLRFSALQRAEIAEIPGVGLVTTALTRFSALQRAEIAEIEQSARRADGSTAFQCSSTSRNC